MNLEGYEPQTDSDWWTSNAPPAGPVTGGAGGGDQFASGLNALYQKYAGRDATADELASHRGNPGGLAAVEKIFTDSGAQPRATAGNAGTAPYSGSGNMSDDQILSQIQQWAAMPGADPSLGADPNYWLGRIKDTGGLRQDNLKYWQDAGVGPTAFFNNPGRESGGNRYAGIGTGGFGAPPAPYASKPWEGGEFTTPETPDYLKTPLDRGTFKLPTKEELYAMPGYQAGLDAVQQGTERSAAAKGTVLNPGTIAAVQQRGLNYADNQYAQLAGLSLGAFQTNAGTALGDRQQNFGEFQTGVGNANTQFQNRYATYLGENARILGDYLTNYGVQHTADTDLWGRLKDLSNSGLDAAKSGRAS